MFDPTAVVQQFQSGGFTHLVWVPDSAFGPWEATLAATPSLTLIRPTREGEAIALAGGLMLGGAKPLVVMQCTGLFEAGDALRNIVHDLQLPLKLLVGIRSFQASLAGQTADNCPDFTEPMIRLWRLPYRLVGRPIFADFAAAIQDLAQATTAYAVLVGE